MKFPISIQLADKKKAGCNLIQGIYFRFLQNLWHKAEEERGGMVFISYPNPS